MKAKIEVSESGVSYSGKTYGGSSPCKTEADFNEAISIAQERICKSGDIAVLEDNRLPNVEIEIVEKGLMEDYLDMAVQGKASVLIHSRAGLGKTYTTLKKLEGKDYKYNSGFASPLALYKELYEHRNKVIVLDDIEGMLKNQVAISILKAALGNGTVSYLTTSKKLGEAPQEFEFNRKTSRYIQSC